MNLRKKLYCSSIINLMFSMINIIMILIYLHVFGNLVILRIRINTKKNNSLYLLLHFDYSIKLKYVCINYFQIQFTEF